MNRFDLYRLVDALPDNVVDEVSRRLAEEKCRLVAEALGTPGKPVRATSTRSSSAIRAFATRLNGRWRR